MVVNTNYSGGVLEKVSLRALGQLRESRGVDGLRRHTRREAGGHQVGAREGARLREARVVDVVSDVQIRAKRGWVPPAISGE